MISPVSSWLKPVIASQAMPQNGGTVFSALAQEKKSSQAASAQAQSFSLALFLLVLIKHLVSQKPQKTTTDAAALQNTPLAKTTTVLETQPAVAKTNKKLWTPSEVATLTSTGNKKPLQLLLEGDSLTAREVGYGPTLTKNYAAKDKSVAIHNDAISGQTIGTFMLSQTPANANKFDQSKDNIAVLWAGTNDLSFGGAKGVTTYDNLNKMAQMYKDKGWKVLVVTSPQRADLADAERLSFNNQIRQHAGNGPWDMVLDLAADPDFSDKDNAVTNNKSIYMDTVHFTAQGNQFIAGAVEKAIETLRE